MKRAFICISLIMSTITAFAAQTETYSCASKNGSTSVKMTVISSQTMEKYLLQSLKIKGKTYQDESQAAIECQINFDEGSSSAICNLKNNIVSIFLSDYTPHSGLVLYSKSGVSVDDVLGLECK